MRVRVKSCAILIIVNYFILNRNIPCAESQIISVAKVRFLILFLFYSTCV